MVTKADNLSWLLTKKQQDSVDTKRAIEHFPKYMSKVLCKLNPELSKNSRSHFFCKKKFMVFIKEITCQFKNFSLKETSTVQQNELCCSARPPLVHCNCFYQE